MDTISICNYQPGEEKEILDLVKLVFDEFVSQDCNKEGIDLFYSFIEPDEFRRRNLIANSTLVAKNSDNQIVGMIEINLDGHICLLFVSKNFQNKAITKKLFSSAKDLCTKNCDGQLLISVNSSIYAVDIYKKLGFSTVGEMKTKNGISFVEMLFIEN